MCPTLCDPMDCSMPGFPVLHYLPEFAQIHVHWVRMPSTYPDLCCPLLLFPSIFPSKRIFSESAVHIRWPIGASASASVLPMNIQGLFPLGLTASISLLSKRLSRIFSITTVQKHWFFSTQPSLWFNSQHLYMTTGKTIALTIWNFAKWHLCFLTWCLCLS